MNAERHNWVATCAPGLESLLARELENAVSKEKITNVGKASIRVEMSTAEAARVLVRSQLISNLHLSIKSFSARSPDMIYDQVRRIHWEKLLKTEDTIRIEVRGLTTDMSLKFGGLRIKDAICDEMKKRGVDRPNVDRHTPTAPMVAFFEGGKCELLWDLQPQALHRRGYAAKRSSAPLRENRAAALVHFAAEKWGSEVFEKPIVDPFCGGGTVGIEALIFHSGAPVRTEIEWNEALLRQLPTLEEDFQTAHKAQQELFAAFLEKHQGEKLLFLSDIDADALLVCEQCLDLSGFKGLTQFVRADAMELARKDGVILSNPPWGGRLESKSEVKDMLKTFGRQIKHHCAPAKVGLALGQGLSKSMGFRPSERIEVSNADYPLDLCLYEVYEGSRGAG